MTGAAASAPTTIHDPTEYSRDGWSGLAVLDRSLRAWDVSPTSKHWDVSPTVANDPLAEAVLAELRARAEGRRPRRA